MNKYAVHCLVGIALAATIVVACGDSSDSKNANTPAAGATTAATKSAASAVTTPRTEVDNLKVSAKEFSFTVNLTSIHKGPPGVDVFFQNDGAEAHTLTFYRDSNFNKPLDGGGSMTVEPGASVGFPFIPPDGTTSLYYRCDIHPIQMKGELKVD